MAEFWDQHIRKKTDRKGRKDRGRENSQSTFIWQETDCCTSEKNCFYSVTEYWEMLCESGPNQFTITDERPFFDR